MWSGHAKKTLENPGNFEKKDNNNNDNFEQIRDDACLNHGECPQKQVQKYVYDLNVRKKEEGKS